MYVLEGLCFDFKTEVLNKLISDFRKNNKDV